MSKSSRTRSQFLKHTRTQPRPMSLFRNSATACEKNGEQKAPGIEQSRDAHAKSRHKLVEHGLRVQAKLKIGSPHDKMEREADSVAERVMSISSLQMTKPSNAAASVIQPQGKQGGGTESDAGFILKK